MAYPPCESGDPTPEFNKLCHPGSPILRGEASVFRQSGLNAIALTTRVFGLDKQNACPHNVLMSRSPSSIAVQSPIRTPYGSQPLGLSSKCSGSVQILFSLCPVSVRYLTSESEPPAMRLYEVDSFSSFRLRLRTPGRVLDTRKSKVGTRELSCRPHHTQRSGAMLADLSIRQAVVMFCDNTEV